MNPVKFVFWDTETTGLNKAFHIPVEIGAVVTDGNLRPVREVNLACRPPRFVLVEPGALLTTGRRVSELLSRSMSGYEASCDFVETVRAVTPACFVTYNGVRFDDPLIQHTLFRYLHDPYLMLKGGNFRIDLLPVVELAFALNMPDLAVPRSEHGKPTFKLDRIAPLNGFDEGEAHSAVGDARAVHYLARLLAQRAPELWDRACCLWSSKNAVRNFIARSDIFVEFTWDWRHGGPCFKALTPVALGRGYAGEFVCLDLTLDPNDYTSLAPDELVTKITIGTKPRPICTVRLNGVPIVFSINDPLVKDRIALDAATLAERARCIRSNVGLRERVLDAVDLKRDSFEEPTYPEQQLYSGGFISDHDTLVAQRFHAAPLASKVQLAATFRDGRLRYLAEHLIYEEWAELLDASTRARIDGEMRTRHLANADAPWTTIASALRDINKLLLEADERARRILLEYREQLLALYPIASAAE
jgi:exodeoxyribonuclease-1